MRILSHNSLLAYWPLEFPTELEKDFRQEYNAQSLPFVRACLLLAAAIFLVFGILVSGLNPLTGTTISFINFVIEPFLLAVILALTFHKAYRNVGQWVLFAQASIVAFGILAIILLTDPSEPGFQLNYVGLVLTMQSAFILGRLRFSKAFLLVLLTLLCYLLICVVIQERHKSPEMFIAFINNFIYLFSAGLITLAGSYLIELSNRRVFIQRIMIESEKEKVDEEKRRSDHLLQSIFPAQIADRLKNGATSIADAHPEASILFLDIVNFSPLAEKIEPAVLISALNDIYTKLDMLTEKYGVEKIKTAGDAYIVASGVPKIRLDHAYALARFAIEASSALAGYCDPQGEPLQFRSGIHSGPVVAGVIGTRKPFYDVWGNTVNIASRMQTCCEIGKIQVTESFKSSCGEQFVFVPRGKQFIKGIGEMVTYHLAGHRMGIDRELITSLNGNGDS